MLHLFLPLILPCTYAALTNITIDDTYGDPQTGLRPEYAPESAWFEQLASTKSLESTWNWTDVHSNSLHLVDFQTASNISIRFNGSTIRAFFAVWPVQDIRLSFYLDGASDPSGVYEKRAIASPELPPHFYNQELFQSDVLRGEEHTLSIEVDQSKYVAFDYAIYTIGDESSAGGESSNTPGTSKEGTSPGSTGSGSSINLGAAVGVHCTCSSGSRRGIVLVPPAASSAPVLCPRLRSREPLDDKVGLHYYERTPAAASDAGGSSSVPSDVKRCERKRMQQPALTSQPSSSAELVDSAAWREELARMRAENEVLRQVAQAAEPPPYSDGEAIAGR
ncbi:hypothetical protein AURDEDRAFT_124003 [Auricularia subglabra TFB-10046 SS5]|nr:hypothetical protein AURDEDRAFT_124003 [Auricularia subglabra TFB-10046 SS5]